MIRNNAIRVIVVLVAMIAALCVQNAGAQNVVTNINTQDKQACGVYLVNHPLDTIRNTFADKVVSIYFEGGQISDTLKEDVVLTHSKRKVKEVTKSGNKVTVVAGYEGSVAQDTTVYEQTTIAEMTFEQQRAFLRGELNAINPEHKDYEGNFRHRVNVTLLGGAIFSRDFISPTASLRLGYETCHWLWELEGGLSFHKYTQSADAKGRYITFSGTFNAGWKFLQSVKYDSYLAVLGIVGYGYQRSDSDKALERSKNYGLIFGAELRGSLSLGNNWSLVGGVGYKLIPEVQKGEDQNLSAGGLFTEMGITKKF